MLLIAIALLMLTWIAMLAIVTGLCMSAARGDRAQAEARRRLRDRSGSRAALRLIA